MSYNVFLALDVSDKNQALQVAERWSSYVKGVKIGPRLGFQLTQKDWAALSEQMELFIDYKFYDIPSTVEASVRASFNLGASFCTVHAQNGKLCLKQLAILEKELSQIRPFKILVVSVLTSFDENTNPMPLSQNKNCADLVLDYADLVFESGLSSMVCSPYEIEKLKSKNEKSFLVTPGVRFSGDSKEDQKRVRTPSEAWKAGADYLVMGRSLLAAQEEVDVKSKAEQLRLEWESAQ